MQVRRLIWLYLGLVAIVFALSLPLLPSLHLPGGIWTWLLLTFVYMAAGMLAMFAWNKIKLFWKGLSLWWKTAIIFSGSAIYLADAFIQNRHKPNSLDEDAYSVFTLLFLLALWGLYSLISHGLDALWFWIKRRRNSL